MTTWEWIDRLLLIVAANIAAITVNVAVFAVLRITGQHASTPVYVGLAVEVAALVVLYAWVFRPRRST